MKNYRNAYPLCVIEQGALIDESVKIAPFTIIEAGVKIGARTTIGAHCVIKSGTTIGKECKIDSGVQFSGHNTTVGDRVTIRNNSVICREFTIEDDVFISPQFMSIYQEFTVLGREAKGGSTIGKGALIGTNVTLDAGRIVGFGSKVGTKAYVVRDVPDGETYVGIPAINIEDHKRIAAAVRFIADGWDWIKNLLIANRPAK